MNRLEQEYQKAVVNYLRTFYPGVKFTIAPANASSARQGKRNKDMGYTVGTPDIMIFKRNWDFNGLFIELKIPEIKDVNDRTVQKKGTVSKEQKEWIDYLNSESYLAVVCYGSEPAMDVIKEYIADKKL